MMLTIALYVVSCGLISSEQDVQQIVIESHEIWHQEDSPIVADFDIIVATSGILEIEPGTEIQLVEGSVREPDPAGDIFRSPVIIIEGVLISKGSPDKLIKFIGRKSLDSGNSEIWIRPKNNGSETSIIEWTELGEVRWNNGFAKIKNSKLNILACDSNEKVEITSNEISYIGVGAKKGTIENNISTSISIIGSSDSIIVKNNVIQNQTGGFGGIRCANGSRPLIINNVIKNCDIAFYIFSATPRIHYNNIVNNTINMAIIPNPQSPSAENDTLYATDNWWGTTDSTLIAEKIELRKNGETESGKKVIFVPFAENPFDLDNNHKVLKFR